MKKLLLTTLLSTLTLTVFAEVASPYKGQETRAIKAMSAKQVDGYLSGKGLGLAKAAELNNFPGPKHVLDYAKQLDFTDQQIKKTKALFKEMQTKAIAVGKKLVNKEYALDQAFANDAINEQKLQKLLIEIGALKSELRYVHLNTHLKQKALMSAHQVHLYDKLRGYGQAHSTKHQHGHGH